MIDLIGHTNAIFSLCFSREGHVLASGKVVNHTFSWSCLYGQNYLTFQPSGLEVRFRLLMQTFVFVSSVYVDERSILVQ